MTERKILELDSSYRNRAIDGKPSSFKVTTALYNNNKSSDTMQTGDIISDQAIIKKWRPYNFALREAANLIFEWPKSNGFYPGISDPRPYFKIISASGGSYTAHSTYSGFSKNSVNVSGFIKDFTDGVSGPLSSIMLQPYFTKGKNSIYVPLNASGNISGFTGASGIITIEGGIKLSDSILNKPTTSSATVLYATSVFNITGMSDVYDQWKKVNGPTNFNLLNKDSFNQGHGILNTESNYYNGAVIQLEQRDTGSVIAVSTIVDYEYLGNDLCKITLSNPLGYGGLDYSNASGGHVLKIIDPTSNINNVLSTFSSNEENRIFVPGGPPDFSYKGMFLYTIQANEQKNAENKEYPTAIPYEITSHDRHNNVITINNTSISGVLLDQYTEFFIRSKKPLYFESYSKHGVIRAHSEKYRIAHTMFGQIADINDLRVSNSKLATEMKSTHEFNIFNNKGLFGSSTIKLYEKGDTDIYNATSDYSVTSLYIDSLTAPDSSSPVIDLTTQEGATGSPIKGVEPGDLLEMVPRSYTGAHELVGTFMIDETDPTKIHVTNFSFNVTTETSMTHIDNNVFVNALVDKFDDDSENKGPVMTSYSISDGLNKLNYNTKSSFQDFVEGQYNGCTINLIWDHYQKLSDNTDNNDFTNVCETRKIKSWGYTADAGHIAITLDKGSIMKFQTYENTGLGVDTNTIFKNGGMFYIIPTIETRVIDKIVDSQLTITQPVPSWPTESYITPQPKIGEHFGAFNSVEKTFTTSGSSAPGYNGQLLFTPSTVDHTVFSFKFSIQTGSLGWFAGFYPMISPNSTAPIASLVENWGTMICIQYVSSTLRFRNHVNENIVTIPFNLASTHIFEFIYDGDTVYVKIDGVAEPSFTYVVGNDVIMYPKMEFYTSKGDKSVLRATNIEVNATAVNVLHEHFSGLQLSDSNKQNDICANSNVVNIDDYYTGLYITLTHRGLEKQIGGYGDSLQYGEFNKLNAIECFSFLITKHVVTNGISFIDIEPRFAIQTADVWDFLTDETRWDGNSEGFSLSTALIEGMTCVIKSCKLKTPFTRTPSYGNDMFSVIKQTKNNDAKIIMSQQLVGDMYEKNKVSISLTNIVLPNSLLSCSKGGYVTEYPFVYVLISSNSMNSSSNTLSNNPNITGQRFKVLIDNYVDDITTKFVVLRPSSLDATIYCNFSFVDEITFEVRMPDGQLFETIEQDSTSPHEPKKDIQISATFVIEKQK